MFSGIRLGGVAMKIGINLLEHVGLRIILLPYDALYYREMMPQ